MCFPPSSSLCQPPREKQKNPQLLSMDALKQHGTAVAISAGVIAFAVVLALLIWALISINKTQTEVKGMADGKDRTRSLAEAEAARLRQGSVAPPVRPFVQTGVQPSVGTGAQAQNISTIGGAGRSMRAAVISTPGGPGVGGHPGAPYSSATATGTFGIPFPSAASRQSGAKPAMRNSIWADALPTEEDAAYKGARARQSAPGFGSIGAVTSTPELFNRTPDELDAKDIDVKDAFPAASDDAPKNGHEAVAAMYNWENFRAAVDRDSGSGYLAPIFERQGWSKMGARDPRIWGEQMEALRDQFPKNMDLKELMDSQMVPVPDQFYDVLYQAAETRGEPTMEGCDGIGAAASGRVFEKLQREWEETKSGRMTSTGPRRGTGAAEAAGIIKEAVQSIPLPPSQGTASLAQAAAAEKVMDEIANARELAAKDGLALPELSASQLRAAAAWAAKPGPGRKAALQLAQRSRTPLPPAPFPAA